MAHTTTNPKHSGQRSRSSRSEQQAQRRLWYSRFSRLRLEQLEDRIAPDATPFTYLMPAGGPREVTLRLDGTDLQIIDSTTQASLASKALAATSAVLVHG